MSNHARIPSDIAILGGGLTGLMTAVRLSELLPNARLTVYEALDRLGGCGRWLPLGRGGQIQRGGCETRAGGWSPHCDR